MPREPWSIFAHILQKSGWVSTTFLGVDLEVAGIRPPCAGLVAGFGPHVAGEMVGFRPPGMNIRDFMELTG
jgi:hypothetical protein